MLGVTFFGLVLTPVFYVAVRQITKFVDSRRTKRPLPAEPPTAPAE
jgi:hypothetical protein